MSDSQTLEKARRRVVALIEQDPRRALAACAAEDPLRLKERGAVLADDEGLLFDPSDLMIDSYVMLVREPEVLADLPGWLIGPFRTLTDDFAQDLPSPTLAAALCRALGIEDKDVEAWVNHFRALPMHDRRDVLALIRGGSPTFRSVYSGRTFDLRRDVIEVHRTFSLFRSLLSRTMR